MTAISLERFATSRAAGAIAALWGFAEATLFFIVPDVFLTFLAMASLRSAARATAWAVAGALLGGYVSFAVASSSPTVARETLVRIPGIDERLIEEVRSQIAQTGAGAVFIGPTKGIPYKVYAVEWAAEQRPLTVFLLISIPARAIRFLLTSALAAGLAYALRRSTPAPISVAIAIHGALWTAFYAAYFWFM